MIDDFVHLKPPTRSRAQDRHLDPGDDFGMRLRCFIPGPDQARTTSGWSNQHAVNLSTTWMSLRRVAASAAAYFVILDSSGKPAAGGARGHVCGARGFLGFNVNPASFMGD